MSNKKSWWVCGKIRTLVSPGRDVNWCRHCGKQFGRSSKSSTQNYHDPTVLLGVDSKEWKAETQTDVVILNYVLCLIIVDNIFSYTEDPKIKKHTQNIDNTRLYQFTSRKNMFQAYDFHLMST